MKTPYVYCIFRLDRKFYKRINSDLKCRGYKHVKAIVPTISVLKKSRKGNNEYEDVPLLFNYGFIKMKSEKAFDRYTQLNVLSGFLSPFGKVLNNFP